MAKKQSQKGEEVEMNMTPMIDVVFQLIIFFMLVTEMAQADLEVMTLPDASEGSPDDAPDKKRLVVNVMAPDKNGECEIKVKSKKRSIEELNSFLKIEAELDRDPKDRRVSNRPLLIRADKEAPFKYVQAVMQECVKPGIGIWKLEFAVTEPKKNKAAE